MKMITMSMMKVRINSMPIFKCFSKDKRLNLLTRWEFAHVFLSMRKINERLKIISNVYKYKLDDDVLSCRVEKRKHFLSQD